MIEFLGLMFFIVYFYSFRKAIDELTQWEKIKEDDINRKRG